MDENCGLIGFWGCLFLVVVVGVNGHGALDPRRVSLFVERPMGLVFGGKWCNLLWSLQFVMELGT